MCVVSDRMRKTEKTNNSPQLLQQQRKNVQTVKTKIVMLFDARRNQTIIRFEPVASIMVVGAI